MAAIEKIALTKLLKLELPQFVEQVTAIVEKHNPTKLKLQNAIKLLHNQCNKMNLLSVPYGPHPLTQRIYELNIKRLEHAAAISMQVNLQKKLAMPHKKEFISLAYPAVRDHLHYLRQNNQPTIDRIIAIFFNHLKDNPEVQNALEKLELKYNLRELEKANDEHCKLSSIRSKEISQRPKSVSAAVQKEAQYVLRGVFEQINFHQFSYEDLNYTPLISELNRLIARFRGLINTRASRGKTRKEKALVENTENESTIQPLPEASIIEVRNEISYKNEELKKKFIYPTKTFSADKEVRPNLDVPILTFIIGDKGY